MYPHAKIFMMKSLAAALIAIQIGGCASFHTNEKSIQAVTDQVEDSQAQFSAFKRSGAVTRIDRPKVGGQEIQIKRVEPLPAQFDQNFFFTSAYSTPDRALNDIAKKIGYRLVIQKMLPDPVVNTAPGTQVDPTLRNSIEWNGTLKGLLDHVTARMDAFWAIRNGNLHVFRTETRSFSLYLPGGKKDTNAAIALSASNGGAGTVNVSSTSIVDPYSSIIKAVEAVVNEGRTTPIPNSVVPNDALGMITVTATPPQLERIESMIDAINKRFAQNVLVGVKIYNLSMRNTGLAGASLEGAYQAMVKKLNVAVTPGSLLAPSSGSPGQVIIGKSDDAKFGGSQAIVQALEEIGDVSFLTSGQVMAINGQPSPIQVANEFTFLASSTTTNTANIGSTTTLTPGTRTVGFTANFLPLILGDNRILLQYQISLSSLLSLNSVSSGTSLIQTPNISTQSLQQQAFVKDGQSIVLFGFDQERAANTSRNALSSTSKNTSKDRSMIVIVLEVYGGK